jgi:F420-dependent oxidoreductase-like protein
MTPFFAYHMPSFTFPGVSDDALFDHVVELARGAEDAGFQLVTVMDHFYQIGVVGPETEPMLEAYTALGALAAGTRTARLATLVTGVTYRNPALLAKMVTTLDVISKGRALLGIGAAWNQSEHEGYGVDFPPIGERMDRLDEALTICRLMFTEERPSFQGRHYRIDQALNSPRPLQAGGPAILVGGGGERRTLRLVARHADMSHWFGSLDDLRHKTEVLERHCEAEGRDPSTITRTVSSPVLPVADMGEADAMLARVSPQMRAGVVAAPPTEAAERLQPYLDAGFTGFFLSNTTITTPEAMAVAGELIRLLS